MGPIYTGWDYPGFCNRPGTGRMAVISTSNNSMLHIEKKNFHLCRIKEKRRKGEIVKKNLNVQIGVVDAREAKRWSHAQNKK